jgi:DtxR family Mn-dependent transcriptional regulator
VTSSEENYIKVIYHLSIAATKGVSTNAIAEELKTKASSVTDMIKKLSDKNFISHQKYYGVTLTEKGKKEAKMIVRKHRLWEVFLVEKLGFSWDEVHDIAEELEHIKSEKLTNKLDAYLGFPITDPHGDPIPDQKGKIQPIEKSLLSEVVIETPFLCVGVKDSSAAFLQYLNKQKITLGSQIKVLEKESYDDSYLIELDGKILTISNKIATNLYVQ